MHKTTSFQMLLLRCIHRFAIRSFVRTTVTTTASDSSATVELCREYGRRMKAHLVRAETEQVLSLLNELMQKHQIKKKQEKKGSNLLSLFVCVANQKSYRYMYIDMHGKKKRESEKKKEVLATKEQSSSKAMNE